MTAWGAVRTVRGSLIEITPKQDGSNGSRKNGQEKHIGIIIIIDDEAGTPLYPAAICSGQINGLARTWPAGRDEDPGYMNSDPGRLTGSPP